MKKIERITTVSMLVLLLVAAVLVAGCTEEKEKDNENGIESLLPEGTPAYRTITLAGIFEKSSIPVGEIAGMEDLIIQLNATRKNETNRYVGVDLYEFLVEIGVKWGAGRVIVEAGDGYCYEFDFHSLYYGPVKLDQDVVLLALAENGEWLEEDTVVKIVAPAYEGKAWVKDVVKITVEPWSVIMNGSVLTELEVPVTDFLDPNEYASHSFSTTVPDRGTETHVGVALSDLVVKAGTPIDTSNATVRVYASDGYFVDFEYGDIIDNPESTDPIILASKIDEEFLPFEYGALRLVAPDDQYENDDTNWFKNVWIKSVVRVEIRE